MSLTIPKLPFGGETLSSFDPSDNTVTESTASGNFETPYSTNCLVVAPGARASSPIWPSASVFWCHYNVAQLGLPFDPVVADFHLDFYSGSTKVLQVLVSGETSMTFDFQTLQGGVMTHVGSVTIPTFNVAPNRFDIGLVAGAAGSLTVAVSDTQQFQVTGLNHAGFAGVTNVVHRAFGDAFGEATSAGWSQVIWDTTSTIGRRLYHELQNSNSAVNVGWTGSVTNVNELPTNDASPLTAGATGLTSTFFQSAFAASGNVIGIWGASRVQTTGTGPTNVKIATRIGGANFFSPLIAVNGSFEACGYPWTSNPATGLPFTDVQASSAEIGVGT